MFPEPSSRIVQRTLPSTISETDRILFDVVKNLLLKPEIYTPERLASHEHFNTGLPDAILVVGEPGAGKSALCSTLLGGPIINIKDEKTGSDFIHVYALDDTHPVTKDGKTDGRYRFFQVSLRPTPES